MHAIFDPKISELSREGGLRRELKHLSNGRKRKQIVIPLLAESEKGLGQAESLTVMSMEMWCDVVPILRFKVIWKDAP